MEKLTNKYKYPTPSLKLSIVLNAWEWNEIKQFKYKETSSPDFSRVDKFLFSACSGSFKCKPTPQALCFASSSM